MMTTPLWRRLLAGAAGLAAVAALRETLGSGELAIAMLPIVLSIVAAVVVHVPRLGAQLFVRAVWWSNFALGVLIAAVGNTHERPCGFAMVTAAGLALGVIGRRGLGEAGERDAFAPVAFRTTFLLLMMLTLADAQTLGVFAVALLSEESHDGKAWIFVGGALGFVIAFLGLYRITLWGALLSVGTSVVLAVVLPFCAHDDKLTVFVCLLCALEILVAAPMIVAVASGRRLPEPPLRVRTWVSRFVLATLWLASAGWAFAR